MHTNSSARLGGEKYREEHPGLSKWDRAGKWDNGHATIKST